MSRIQLPGCSTHRGDGKLSAKALPVGAHQCRECRRWFPHDQITLHKKESTDGATES